MLRIQPNLWQAFNQPSLLKQPSFSAKKQTGYPIAQLHFDEYNMTPCAVGKEQGVNTTALFGQHQPTVASIINSLWEQSDNPKANLGWLKLHNQDIVADTINQYAQKIKGQFDDVVILGIGGSALGTRAMFEALLPANWNQLPKEKRQGYPRYHILDNIDPDHLSETLDNIDLKKTLVNVVSKSGSTAEPMAQYLILKEKLQQAVGPENTKNHLVFTTDPKVGVLKEIANQEGIQTFSIPPTAGGRFSIFSPVGLLPAALMGIPINQILDGLKEINQSLKNPDIFKNPAAQAAVLDFDAFKKGKNISVIMPYSQKLAPVADWFVQLWAESLGKANNVKGEFVHTGQTPVKAVGATDQHSQAQLFNAGPFDKVVHFIRLAKFKNPLPIPKLHNDKESLNYLGGKNIENLMQAEFEGTRQSLNLHRRPNTTLTLPELTPKTFAQLLQFLMFKTAVMADLLNINGFDQPSVELGKQITYGIMGRKGFEKFKP